MANRSIEGDALLAVLTQQVDRRGRSAPVLFPPPNVAFELLDPQGKV
ncbi:MAG: hypothetical protein QOE90_3520 [Thermoplasmata archaeon]|jgi:hypothetical protein|nr:hypothetical protein [Thermoplasmata archaeon]